MYTITNHLETTANEAIYFWFRTIYCCQTKLRLSKHADAPVTWADRDIRYIYRVQQLCLDYPTRTYIPSMLRNICIIMSTYKCMYPKRAYRLENELNVYNAEAMSFSRY